MLLEQGDSSYDLSPEVGKDECLYMGGYKEKKTQSFSWEAPLAKDPLP